MKAAVFTEFGGPEVLHLTDLQEPAVGPGQAIVQMRAIGLNFADIYRRRGEYGVEPPSPFVLGYEGAGVIEASGELPPGTRVAFADVPRANAERVVAPVDKLIPLPADISDEQAASVLLQGMTAHYLAHDSHRVLPGETVLIHSAAGGVGGLLTQICKLRGARVVGTVSRPEKVAIAEEAGADEVIVTTADDFVAAAVKRLTGKQPDAIYDGNGNTLAGSLRLVRPRGTVVFFGWAGGTPPLVDAATLMDQSKTLVGGDLWSHLPTRQVRIDRARELFQWMREGKLRVRRTARFPLEQIAQAHRLMESRRSTGKILLLP